MELSIPERSYCLTGGLPNEAYCINVNGDIWEVYYSERGNKTSLVTFENENEACRHLFKMLCREFHVQDIEYNKWDSRTGDG